MKYKYKYTMKIDYPHQYPLIEEGRAGLRIIALTI